MGHRYAAIAFTESVQQAQQALGSRAGNAAMQEGEDYSHVLGERELAFIAARDSFYMASVSETGWPYVQHRGGPPGFVRSLDPQTIGFADFRGNRQYISVGNLVKDDRVSLFFMDYPNRTRLKLFGRVRLIDPLETELLALLEVNDYRAPVERGLLIHVEAFDWNCPQHITPRYTESQVDDLVAPLLEENRTLKAAMPGQGISPTLTLGEGPLQLAISGVRQLTTRIRTYELRDPDGAELPAVEAGAHLQVPVRLADGKTITRHYSICSDPARRDAYEIAVLRVDDGTGGSLAIHDIFQVGVLLRCGLPQNHFALHNDLRPAVLIAGGIGITPIKVMAQVLKARGNAFQLHFAARSVQEMAFRDRLRREFGDSLTTYSSAEGERMAVERVLLGGPDEAFFYVCGPDRLIDEVSRVASTLNIDWARIRFERFTAMVNPDARPIQVELSRSGRQLRVTAEQSVLDAMLEAGVDASFGCRAGTCRSCVVKVVAGEPDHRDSALSAAEREDYRLMCPCVSRAKGEYLALDI
jgi:ferredoxin-NADP reductase/predicted pyridoxine 5'-phosphate oxidase superfamily flavin-nucleotide-binding protein